MSGFPCIAPPSPWGARERRCFRRRPAAPSPTAPSARDLGIPAARGGWTYTTAVPVRARACAGERARARGAAGTDRGLSVIPRLSTSGSSATAATAGAPLASARRATRGPRMESPPSWPRRGYTHFS